MWILGVLLIFFPSSQGLSSGTQYYGTPSVSHGKCENITIPMCRGIAYNQTIFPNLMGNHNQEDAGDQMSSFMPLINLKCSPHIHLFLCIMFSPVCTMIPYPIPPCRSLCIAARHNCKDMLQNFGYSWPSQFDCSKFPVGGKPDELCVQDSNQTGFTDDELERFQSSTPKTPRRPGEYEKMMDFKCPVQLQMPRELEYKLYIGRDQVVEDCGAPCYHNITFFNKPDIQTAHVWIFSWSLLCLVSCLFTLATFFIDMSRFPYPERPIIYLALCHCFIAIVFIIGYAHEEDITCNEAVANRSMNFLTEKTIKQGKHHDWRCTLTAMFLYFFLMAGSLWWVILTITWFLSAGLKWGQEAIDAKSQFFHGVAWSIPAIQTVVALIMKKVEGDVLSGVCFVGLWNAHALRWYVLAPLFTYLVVGTIFLILGFTSLIRIRSHMKHDGAKTDIDKLDRLITRIGIFSLLYTLPDITLIACYFYEQNHLPDWTQLWQEDICREPLFKDKWQTPCRFPDGQQPDVKRPMLSVFLIKYLSILLIGIISGFWVWCGKTITTWKTFFARLSGRNRPEAYV